MAGAWSRARRESGDASGEIERPPCGGAADA